MEKETDLEWPCDEWLLSPDTLELIYKYRAGLPLLLDRDVKKLKKQVAMEQEEKRRNTTRIKAAEVGVEVEGEMNKGAKQSQSLQGESARAGAPKQVLSAGVLVDEPVQEQAAGVELQDQDNEDPSMIRIKEEPVSSDEECEKVAVEQKVKDFLTQQHEQTFQQRLAANYFGFETPKNLTNGRSKEQNKATFHDINARGGGPRPGDFQENGQNGIEGAAGEEHAGIPTVNHAEEAKKKFTKAQLFLVNQIDRSEHFCYTPILHAIEENNDAAVQWLLQHGAILPAGLPQASERNAFEIKFLMEHGIDRDAMYTNLWPEDGATREDGDSEFYDDFDDDFSDGTSSDDEDQDDNDHAPDDNNSGGAGAGPGGPPSGAGDEDKGNNHGPEPDNSEGKDQRQHPDSDKKGGNDKSNPGGDENEDEGDRGGKDRDDGCGSRKSSEKDENMNSGEEREQKRRKAGDAAEQRRAAAALMEHKNEGDEQDKISSDVEKNKKMALKMNIDNVEDTLTLQEDLSDEDSSDFSSHESSSSVSSDSSSCSSEEDSSSVSSYFSSDEDADENLAKDHVEKEETCEKRVTELPQIIIPDSKNRPARMDNYIERPPRFLGQLQGAALNAKTTSAIRFEEDRDAAFALPGATAAAPWSSDSSSDDSDSDLDSTTNDDVDDSACRFNRSTLRPEVAEARSHFEQFKKRNDLWHQGEQPKEQNIKASHAMKNSSALDPSGLTGLDKDSDPPIPVPILSSCTTTLVSQQQDPVGISVPKVVATPVHEHEFECVARHEEPKLQPDQPATCPWMSKTFTSFQPPLRIGLEKELLPTCVKPRCRDGQEDLEPLDIANVPTCAAASDLNLANYELAALESESSPEEDDTDSNYSEEGLQGRRPSIDATKDHDISVSPCKGEDDPGIESRSTTADESPPADDGEEDLFLVGESESSSERERPFVGVEDVKKFTVMEDVLSAVDHQPTMQSTGEQEEDCNKTLFDDIVEDCKMNTTVHVLDDQCNSHLDVHLLLQPEQQSVVAKEYELRQLDHVTPDALSPEEPELKQIRDQEPQQEKEQKILNAAALLQEQEPSEQEPSEQEPSEQEPPVIIEPRPLLPFPHTAFQPQVLEDTSFLEANYQHQEDLHNSTSLQGKNQQTNNNTANNNSAAQEPSPSGQVEDNQNPSSSPPHDGDPMLEDEASPQKDPTKHRPVEHRLWETRLVHQHGSIADAPSHKRWLIEFFDPKEPEVTIPYGSIEYDAFLSYAFKYAGLQMGWPETAEYSKEIMEEENMRGHMQGHRWASKEDEEDQDKSHGVLLAEYNTTRNDPRGRDREARRQVAEGRSRELMIDIEGNSSNRLGDVLEGSINDSAAGQMLPPPSTTTYTTNDINFPPDKMLAEANDDPLGPPSGRVGVHAVGRSIDENQNTQAISMQLPLEPAAGATLGAEAVHLRVGGTHDNADNVEEEQEGALDQERADDSAGAGSGDHDQTNAVESSGGREGVERINSSAGGDFAPAAAQDEVEEGGISALVPADFDISNSRTSQLQQNNLSTTAPDEQAHQSSVLAKPQEAGIVEQRGPGTNQNSTTENINEGNEKKVVKTDDKERTATAQGEQQEDGKSSCFPPSPANSLEVNDSPMVIKSPDLMKNLLPHNNNKRRSTAAAAGRKNKNEKEENQQQGSSSFSTKEPLHLKQQKEAHDSTMNTAGDHKVKGVEVQNEDGEGQHTNKAKSCKKPKMNNKKPPALLEEHEKEVLSGENRDRSTKKIEKRKSRARAGEDAGFMLNKSSKQNNAGPSSSARIVKRGQEEPADDGTKITGEQQTAEDDQQAIFQGAGSSSVKGKNAPAQSSSTAAGGASAPKAAAGSTAKRRRKA
ncbi:unnamed protein product [Amoebophrya sp. A120]|nr:unnamed protein product [Amoebophrya sp. A120]|eukprot:GSA120T00009370001.1